MAKLNSLRVASGLSTYVLADKCGFSQSKVTKIENGKTRPSPADVARILDALEVSDTVHDSLTKAAQEAFSTQRRVLPRRMLADAGLVADMDCEALTLRSRSHHFISTLLQTPEYAMQVRRLAHMQHVSDHQHVANCMRRQAASYSGKQQHVLLISYQLLLPGVVTGELHMEQLSALQRRMRLPGIELGILEDGVPLPAVSFFSGIYDKTCAYFERGAFGELSTDKAEVETCVEDFDAVAAVAVWGREAERLIVEAKGRVAEIDLRNRSHESVGKS